MAGQVDKERLFYLLSFIVEDIDAVLKNAQKNATWKKIRHQMNLQPIVQEASLSINQIILGAKKEFGIGGLEAETPLDPATHDALAEEIEAIDAMRSLPSISEELMERLGINFVRKVREELERMTRSIKNPEERMRLLSQEIEKACDRARSVIPEQDVLLLVEGDLGALRAYYLDPDNFRS